MPLYIKIAFRYLFSISSKGLSFLTFISIAGIAVGVAALIIALSVMSGFEYGLKKKITDNNPHILILKIGDYIHMKDYTSLEKELINIEGVQYFEPIIYNQAIVKMENHITPVFIKGIQPQKDIYVSGLDKKLVAGNYFLLEKGGYAVVGIDLALLLNVWVGDKIRVFSPYGKRTPFGFVPKTKKFKIAGIVDFGVYELNSSFVAVNIKDAQNLFNMENSFTGIQIKLLDPFQADKIKSIILEKLPEGYIAKSWIDINRTLFQALELEKLGMFLVLTLIVLVASFNVASLLITKAREKRKEIAILKTVGATNSFILKIFVWQGLIIGFIGVLVGLITGLVVVHLVDKYKLIKLNPEVYMISYLPLKISYFDIALVVFSALLIAFISSYVPSKIASKEVPAKVLRYE